MPLDLFLAMLIVALGAFVQGSIGFGMAVVAAPILFLLDPAYLPAPMIMATLANALYSTWYYRSNLAMGELSAAMIARIPGSLVGAYLLLVISVQWLAVFIAVVIVSGIALTWFRISIPFTRVNLALAGFASGVMGTSTSIGGPPVALVMQGQAANRIRGNLGAFFIFSSVVSLLVLAPTSRFSAKEFGLGVALVVPSLLGTWAASRVSHRFSDRFLHRGTMLVCALAVIGMLSQYLDF